MNKDEEGFRPLTGRCVFILIFEILDKYQISVIEFPSPYGEMCFYTYLSIVKDITMLSASRFRPLTGRCVFILIMLIIN